MDGCEWVGGWVGGWIRTVFGVGATQAVVAREGHGKQVVGLGEGREVPVRTALCCR